MNSIGKEKGTKEEVPLLALSEEPEKIKTQLQCPFFGDFQFLKTVI
jgi:hypothetical protein